MWKFVVVFGITLMLAGLVCTWSDVLVPQPSYLKADTRPSATPPDTAVSSNAAIKDGLSVVVTLPKAGFAADEPLKFTVQFKNVGQKAFSLVDADYFWGWAMRLEDVSRGGPWGVHKLFKDEREVAKSRTLQPGESLDVPVELVGGDGRCEFAWEGEQSKPVAALKQLKPGKYKLTIAVSLAESPASREIIPAYWTGTITSEPVELEITENPDATGSQPKAR